jgi:hypothetical protein
MKYQVGFCSIVILIVSWIPGIAQNTKTSSADVRLDKEKPNVYISLERQGAWKPLKKFESKERVWLRLNNNSKWSVATCMWDISKEYGDTELTYEVERYEKIGRVVKPVTEDSEGSCPLGVMGPGKSVLFSVPREHLIDGLAIKVQFRYEWETDPDGFTSDLEPKHFVYFHSFNLQKN